MFTTSGRHWGWAVGARPRNAAQGPEAKAEAKAEARAEVGKDRADRADRVDRMAPADREKWWLVPQVSLNSHDYHKARARRVFNLMFMHSLLKAGSPGTFTIESAGGGRKLFARILKPKVSVRL